MYHTPVMLREVVERLVTSRGGTYLDCTLGGGGHSRAILAELDANGRLVALDWDEDAHTLGTSDLEEDPRVIRLRLNFARLDELPSAMRRDGFHGILLDLGMASHHVDSDRGFAFSSNGPLDMRMDRRRSVSATELLKTLSESELGRVLRDYGEVRPWRRLAAAIRGRVEREGLETTGELREVVEGLVGRSGSYKILSQTFMGLRIAVNEELENLERGLELAVGLLRPSGTLAVITYNSLEDRIVKHRFRRWSGETGTPRHLPLPPEAVRPVLRLMARRGITPGVAERAVNPRSRSARLRLAVRTEEF